MNSYSPELFRTAKGTPYFKSPGIALIGESCFYRDDIRPFLTSFGDQFDVEDYIEDREPLVDTDPLRSMSLGGHLAKFSGQLCYLSFNKARTRSADGIRYFDNIKKNLHGSVLEHVSYSMLLYGIDRACSHEIVRHRSGFAYSQVSQRYVSGASLRFVERPEYQNDTRLHWEFECWIDRAAEQYNARADLLKDVGKDLESKTEQRKARNQAARAALPNETETAMVMTGNVRAWRHFIEMRANKHADLPIRKLAFGVFEILRENAYEFFSDYVVDGDTVSTPYRKV